MVANMTFYQIAEKQNLFLKDFFPCPPIDDRNAWNGLDEEWKKETVRLGEKFLDFQYPYLSAADYMTFLRTGDRVSFEDKYFLKRHALNALVLAECVENKGRFMDGIVNGIFSLCEESAWQLPPHNSYVRDMPQLPLPDITDPILDLFACETGAVLSCVYYLMKSKLDEISSFITKRIFYELRLRIFLPYAERHFWWMGNGKEPMNNWTVWCTQNVLLSVFLIATPQKLRRDVLLKACKSIDYFLAEYGEDGCCDEGAQYYRHAGLCLFNSMEILNRVTDHAFSSLYREPKIKNIASYIWNVHAADQYYINFADCSPVAGRAGVREFLFAERTENEQMKRFAASDFHAGLPDSLLLSSENNLYYRLQNGFCITEIKNYHAGTSESPKAAPAFLQPPDIYYKSAGLFIARDSSFCLAVKAGDNADSHNHNDTGSFTIYKNGRPFFIDIGVESYTKQTFSPDRYRIWTMQSAYHNLPTVDNLMQKDGASYRAENVRYLMEQTVSEIEMDIAKAYPPETGLLFYQRYAALIKGKEIIIRDRFAFQNPGNHSVCLSFMTYEKPVGSAADSLSFSIGALGSLHISSAQLICIEEIPITDPRLKTAWDHEIYRILVKVTGDETTMHIS